MNLAFALELERSVWDALVTGDAVADRAALSDDFLGVYPTGFADAEDHAAQVVDGPTVASFALDEERLLVFGPDHVMLCYRAVYRRLGSDSDETMYVSSLWALRDGRWQNIFSQDTPVGANAV